jgi:hypothetical protein
MTAIRTGVLVGAVGFALGFFGPMILDPTSGNGPMLGIFITGPIGFVVGWLWGLWRTRRSRPSSGAASSKPRA